MSNLPKGLEFLNTGGIQVIIPDDPSHQRSVLKDYEWRTVKEAIDGIREDEEDVGARDILMAYRLWDYNGSTVDEDMVKDIYIRNT